MHEEVKNDMKWWGYVSKYYKKYGTPYTFACNRGDLPNYVEYIYITILELIN